jgi:hypothetical protein
VRCELADVSFDDGNELKPDPRFQFEVQHAVTVPTAPAGLGGGLSHAAAAWRQVQAQPRQVRRGCVQSYTPRTRRGRA